jgi:hypothetical protein
MVCAQAPLRKNPKIDVLNAYIEKYGTVVVFIGNTGKYPHERVTSNTSTACSWGLALVFVLVCTGVFVG